MFFQCVIYLKLCTQTHTHEWRKMKGKTLQFKSCKLVQKFFNFPHVEDLNNFFSSALCYICVTFMHVKNRDRDISMCVLNSGFLE